MERIDDEVDRVRLMTLAMKALELGAEPMLLNATGMRDRFAAKATA